ncbi:hypothetical protein CFOL_v3_24176 [Cephalotus follicularis]|uniref:Uncharacterized protein n=1 Tax=Cephalotus follicularis TaxID=3775 RepID=A0A1Q3CKF6_CEPFO|nr:hypothetical protein CFOL_v3_24176 [Cephalotus follicularis]
MRSSRRKGISISLLPSFLLATAIFTAISFLIFTLRGLPSSPALHFASTTSHSQPNGVLVQATHKAAPSPFPPPSSDFDKNPSSCATVEEMGERGFSMTALFKESLRVRFLIQRHFHINGASRVRALSPEQFCRHGFVMGKASEAGFGNEMYKILTGAALSVMLNRSLIIGQTRGNYPFGEYISYSNVTFTMKEVKHLWRKNGCVKKYGRHLVMRIDNFEEPAQTNVLCSNWRKWKHPIIWFQGTTDAMAAQFFLKNVHPEMRIAASDLFGRIGSLSSRPNAFGELMKILISPSEDVEEAVNWVLGGGVDPDITLHMRMLMNRSVRALQAALNCLRRAVHKLHQTSRPRVVLVSDTPSLVKSLLPNISEFAEVVHFDYKDFKGNISRDNNRLQSSDFRVKDWGPAPRWVAFVDFFLASRAKHTVISGAYRRVGTTYAQLIAAFAAANSLGENSSGPSFSFLSSFQSNLLREGLRMQVGWGHVWNRFAGPLSCRNQHDQCAFTPLLPPAWWDGLWQSPIDRDIRRLAAYGVQLSGFGTIDENAIQSFCDLRRDKVRTIILL